MKWNVICHDRDRDTLRIVTRSGLYTRDITRPTRSSLARIARMANHREYTRLVLRRVTCDGLPPLYDYAIQAAGTYIYNTRGLTPC